MNLHVATVATDVVWKDAPANIAATEKHVAEVLKRWPKTDVILFPEISLMGALEQDNIDIAEPLDGPTTQAIRDIAKRHNVALICGMIQRNQSGNPRNTTFVASKDGELIAAYNKNHLFTESDEPKCYSPGENLVTFELAGWKCGISICFDIRFPRLFATYKKAGVECMFSGFNWIQGRNKPEIMKHLVKARAHENQFFFVAVDRNGTDPYTSYYGTSVISNPYCEDMGEQDGIYAAAELNKDDITALATALPLEGSFKAEYRVIDGSQSVA